MEGTFCISLDFEKYWGIHDVTNWQSKQEELQQVELVVSHVLKGFEEYNVHASWATVGLLMHESLDEIKAFNESRNYGYSDSNFSPFPIHSDKYKNIPDDIITGLKELSRINECPGQEIASHTYSHYYTLENGQTKLNYQDDLTAFQDRLDEHKFESKSIVFPRNQINNSYLEMQAEKGFIAFRGNQENNLWSNSPYASESLVKKGKRFLDAYYNVSNTQSKSIDEIEVVAGMVNIPANRFFRPSSGKSVLEKRKIKRVKDEMTAAAEKGHIYHLWWHPHNFSKRSEEHFGQLNEVLEHFESLKNSKGMRSLNMTEIGKAALEK